MAMLKEKFNMNHTQACKVIGRSRTLKYYAHKMPMKDASVGQAIKETIGTKLWGRKKVIPMVQRDFPQWSASKIRRVYENEGYSMFKRPRKRRYNNPPNPIRASFRENEQWGVDFMSDILENGRQIRTLNIIDHYNRVCKGIEIDFSIPARKAIEILERAIEKYGKPSSIRTDNGPEFCSKRFQIWLHDNNIKWEPIQKGKPQQNCYIERFNRTFREEFLDANLLVSIEQANTLTRNWIEEYNGQRPHESLGQIPPIQFAA
jgi:putative transposase